MMANPVTQHHVRWFVYAGGQKLARQASMRGHWDGYDATCSCGWESRTGGAIKARIIEEVRLHKILADCQK